MLDHKLSHIEVIVKLKLEAVYLFLNVTATSLKQVWVSVKLHISLVIAILHEAWKRNLCKIFLGLTLISF